ncbi:MULTISPECIES: hypothetical protein [unclassified Ekhidna]|jgi:phosphatidylserine synthase|uniref:hypothetical protein n=1 Tax=unclassified Ekhidna TaxID=2632188 RepID=UPI0032E01B62
MKKWITLALITVSLLVAGYYFESDLNLHESYFIMVAFFAIQALVLFRIEMWAPDEWKVQISLVKIVIRLLSSLVFIMILIYTHDDLRNLVIQFIILYLIFMIFEIVEALTNLRRN